jgi:hypothetical protein
LAIDFVRHPTRGADAAAIDSLTRATPAQCGTAGVRRRYGRIITIPARCAAQLAGLATEKPRPSAIRSMR